MRSSEPADRRAAIRAALREARAARRALDRLEASLVREARVAGIRWREIGADLGMTRQGAHRRHRRHDPTPPRRTIEQELLAEIDAVARQLGLTGDSPS